MISVLTVVVVAFLVGAWWARKELRDMAVADAVLIPNFETAKVSQSPASLTVMLTCLWCLQPAFEVPRKGLMAAPRESQPCSHCGQLVSFVSQDEGGRWCIS